MAENELSRDLPFDIEDTYEVQGKALESRLKLSRCDSEVFLGILDNPPDPNEALKEAAETYKKLIRDGGELD